MTTLVWPAKAVTKYRFDRFYVYAHSARLFPVWNSNLTLDTKTKVGRRDGHQCCHFGFNNQNVLNNNIFLDERFFMGICSALHENFT